jgi:mono/diheme cytochrome c family protein
MLAGVVLVSAPTARALAADLSLVDVLHDSRAEHVDQFELTNLVRSGLAAQAFEEAFELGDELFATNFNALDGVGANVGQGQRFTRVPRADLRAFGEWATHVPKRATGPNAQACAECHGVPAEDGAGAASGNVSRDPLHSANLGSVINRNTPHLFGIGGVQRLAEEMTKDLHALREVAIAEAGRRGGDVRKGLQTHGVDFGVMIAHANGSVDTLAVRGVDPDLVVRPFQWKGTMLSVRAFNRDAAHNELGMQAVEIAGDNSDGDFDGVMNELTVGDLTALAVYNAAQPRPTTRIELASLGLIPALSAEERGTIVNGEAVFDATGCASCHVKSMNIRRPIFSEPSQNPNYRDAVFPAGQDPTSRGVDPNSPVTFDLTRDQPDNQITDASGRIKFRLGAFEKDRQGQAIVRLFGDLKRHDMGAGLAESIDEEGTGTSVFLTENLWGVGSTAPYLHDGRGTTLTEAILEHGGEAEVARSAFQGLSAGEQKDLVAFLNNLVLFKMEEEAAETSPEPTKPRRHTRR